MPAETHHSSRTRLVAAVRSGVARMVRATMSSSGPRELATRSRNQPLIASPMEGKPGPLPNGNGSLSRSRSPMPPLPDGEVVGGAAGAGAVVVGVGGGPSVLDGPGGPVEVAPAGLPRPASRAAGPQAAPSR